MSAAFSRSALGDERRLRGVVVAGYVVVGLVVIVVRHVVAAAAPAERDDIVPGTSTMSAGASIGTSTRTCPTAHPHRECGPRPATRNSVDRVSATTASTADALTPSVAALLWDRDPSASAAA